MRQKLEVRIKQGDVDIDLVIKFKKKESGIYIEGLADLSAEAIGRPVEQNEVKCNGNQGNDGLCGKYTSARKSK